MISPMTGEDSMRSVVTAIGQATPEWLTGVLRRAGHLPVGEVRSLTVTRVHTEQLASISYFLSATYSTGAPTLAPQRLYLKLPSAGADSAVTALVGEREVRMYQALARDQQTLPVIPCYEAVYDPERQAYHLLLDDLSATHDQPAWHLTIADHYIEQTVDCLARLHAYWWEHLHLDNGMAELPTQESLRADVMRLREGFPGFVDELGHRLASEDRVVYELILDRLPTLWQRRTDRHGQTMIHGDAHFWNFLYPRDPRSHATYVLDWQTYRIGIGAHDLAYTIVLRYPHRTPCNERALIERYHKGLLEHGVTNYSWEACWEDYCRSASEQVLFPLGCWIDGHLPEAFWGKFVDRGLAGFRDLGCADLLSRLD